MSIKNFIVMLLAISFFTFSLSGYQAVSAASEIDISEPVELTWLTIGSGDQPDITKVEAAVNKYLKNKTNTTLNLITFDWGEFTQRVSIYMAAGEQFDISFTSSWAPDYNRFARMDLYTDITDILDDFAPKTKALLGEKILNGAKVDGRIYAIPTYNSNITNNHGILLNKKLVQKYKVDTSKIKKLQDLEPIFKKIKGKEPKVICFNPFQKYGDISGYETLNYDKLISFRTPGAVLRDGKSTKVINNFDTADSKTFFTLMNKWYKNGYIKNSIYDLGFFKINKSNIFAMYSQLYPTLTEDLLIDEKIDMVPVELSKPSLTTSSITVSMQAISYNSSNPERALMFLERVNTDEKLSNMLNFGIEGVHYKKTGAKTISQLPAGIDKYNPMSVWQFGNESITYSLPGHSPKVWDKVKDNVKKAVASPLLGFTFDSKPVQSEVLKLESIVNKYYKDLSMGKLDPNVNLTKMNNELKKAGLSKVLTEMQKQVNAFVKADY